MYIMTLIYTSYNYHLQASDTFNGHYLLMVTRVSLKEHKNGKQTSTWAIIFEHEILKSYSINFQNYVLVLFV